MMITRFLFWNTHQLGTATALTLLLIYLAMGSLLAGLSTVLRGFDLNLAIPLAIVGVGLGWSLARLPRLPAWLAGLIALSLGSEAIGVRVGRLETTLLALLQSLFGMAWDLWRWPVAGAPDTAAVQAALAQLGADVSVLTSRLGQWLFGLTVGTPSFDPVATTIIWSLALWVVAVWTGWVMRRHARPLTAMAPAGVLLVTVLAHTREFPASLLSFMGTMLLLLALVRHHARERRWQSAGVGYSEEIQLDMAAAVIPIALALLAAAWLVSNISFRPLNNFVKTVIWGQTSLQNLAVADSLGLEARAEAATPLDRVRRGGLPRSHLLGSGPELSEQVVMVIQTNDPRPALPDQPVPRYYWRSLTYDRYTGRGWETGRTQRLDYEAGQVTAAEVQPRQRLLRQTVQGSDYYNDLIYVAGDLISADQAFSVDWRGPNDIFGATTEGAAYQAESRLPVFSEAELRAAGTDYPESMNTRYLALPDSVPNRVLSLARDLTATAPTPYDRAKAIEGYLRAFPYNLDLPPPPPGRDVADYFLFELQQGYCDYYATSMVTLARAAGLPARLAIGYIHGSYEAETHRYIVTEAEAHSWVEIYFPEYGWVNFEPTGGRPAIEREADTPPELAQVPPPEGPSPDRGGVPIWFTLAAAGLILALGGLIAWNAIDMWRLRRLAPAAAVTTLHQRLYRYSPRLRVPLARGHTPYEFATALVERISNLATRSRWSNRLSPAAQEVSHLTDLYVRSLFSPGHASPADQAQAIRLWQRLRGRLWLAWVLNRKQDSL